MKGGSDSRKVNKKTKSFFSGAQKISRGAGSPGRRAPGSAARPPLRTAAVIPILPLIVFDDANDNSAFDGTFIRRPAPDREISSMRMPLRTRL